MAKKAGKPTTPATHGYLQSDEPIRRRHEDRLGRAELAEAIADQVIHSPPGQGFVIALEGRWGSGKTSAINMIADSVEEHSNAIILRFNPWLFAGSDVLVGSFLKELGTQLGEKAEQTKDDRLKGIGARVGHYGDVLVPLGWVPVVGPWMARLGMVVGFFSKRSASKAPASVHAQQQEVKAALAELDRRVLVIVDDLDRIEPDQIRDVMRLIKLVADFPNVTYLLGYDGERVAEALADNVKDGQKYLEKVVQVSHTLPEIEDWPLIVLLQAELDAALVSIDHGHFSRDDWIDVFHSGIRPFFKNLRDVRRYLNTVPVSLRVLGADVALVDALGLEAIRVFVPAAYAKLPGLATELTGNGATSADEARAGAVAIDTVVAGSSPHQEAVRKLLTLLFPLTGAPVENATKRRVADPAVFRIYLRRTLPAGLVPAELVHEATASMGDKDSLTELLVDLDPHQLADLLGRLEDAGYELDPSAAEVAIEVLINQMPRLRETRQGLLQLGPHVAVRRITRHALGRVGHEGERVDLVKRVLPRIDQLSGRHELIGVAGYTEGAGRQLIPATVAAELKREQNELVLSATPDVLAEERILMSLFRHAIEYEDGAHKARVGELCADDRVLLRLLASSVDDPKAPRDPGADGSPVLPWDELALMVSGSAALNARVAHIAQNVDRSKLDEHTLLALDTAMRYAGSAAEPAVSKKKN